MATLDGLRSDVETLVQDSYQIIDAAEYDVFSKTALDVYSRERPYEQIYDITGAANINGSKFEWNVLGNSPLVNDWIESFSQIRAVEFPAGKTDEREPQFIDDDQWRIITKATGTIYFRLLSDTPSTGDTVRITYTVPHILSDLSASTTIYQEDENAFIHLWAAFCCNAIQAHYSHSHDSTIVADIVDHGALGEKFKQLREDYMGIWDKQFPKAIASQNLDWDIGFAWSRSGARADFLTHKKAWR